MNNIWQIIMAMMQKRKQEEEQRRMLEAGKLGGHGATDSGMSLEQMFQQFRPQLYQGWQSETLPPQMRPQRPPPQTMI